MYKSVSHSVVSDSLWPGLDYSPPGSSVHGILQARILEWVAIPLSRGIFPTQGSNPGLWHCRQILYCLSHQGNSRILEWVAYLFSRGTSQPRNWTGVSCVAGRFFTSWATREVHALTSNPQLSISSLWFFHSPQRPSWWLTLHHIYPLFGQELPRYFSVVFLPSLSPI